MGALSFGPMKHATKRCTQQLLQLLAWYCRPSPVTFVCRLANLIICFSTVLWAWRLYAQMRFIATLASLSPLLSSVFVCAHTTYKTCTVSRLLCCTPQCECCIACQTYCFVQELVSWAGCTALGLIKTARCYFITCTAADFVC